MLLMDSSRATFLDDPGGPEYICQCTWAGSYLYVAWKWLSFYLIYSGTPLLRLRLYDWVRLVNDKQLRQARDTMSSAKGYAIARMGKLEKECL